MTALRDQTGTHLARDYRANRLPSGTAPAQTIHQMPGIGLCMSNRALPPMAEYDAYVQSLCKPQGGSKMTGAKLRRIVTMRRNGCGWREIAEAIGITSGNAWYYNMPGRLKGDTG